MSLDLRQTVAAVRLGQHDPVSHLQAHLDREAALRGAYPVLASRWEDQALGRAWRLVDRIDARDSAGHLEGAVLVVDQPGLAEAFEAAGALILGQTVASRDWAHPYDPGTVTQAPGGLVAVATGVAQGAVGETGLPAWDHAGWLGLWSLREVGGRAVAAGTVADLLALGSVNDAEVGALGEGPADLRGVTVLVDADAPEGFAARCRHLAARGVTRVGRDMGTRQGVVRAARTAAPGAEIALSGPVAMGDTGRPDAVVLSAVTSGRCDVIRVASALDAAASWPIPAPDLRWAMSL